MGGGGGYEGADAGRKEKSFYLDRVEEAKRMDHIMERKVCVWGRGGV